MKIIFMGTPAFAVPTLNALIASSHEVAAVYTAPPRPAGRGKQLRKSDVHLVAEAAGLDVRTPKSLKNEELPECDIAVVVAYGMLLPKHVLDAPKYGCLNLHPSALPRWRGAAPLQRTIMAGDKKTAVCIMQMDEGLDTGDVLLREDFDLSSKVTAGELHDQCAALGAEMMVEVLDEITELKPKPQSDEGATYAKKILKEDERIDWSATAKEIEWKIRGLNPFPGAYFEHDNVKIKVFAADVVESDGDTGQAIDDKLLISCGENSLRITELQKQGKRRMLAADFLQGNQVLSGTVLK